MRKAWSVFTSQHILAVAVVCFGGLPMDALADQFWDFPTDGSIVCAETDLGQTAISVTCENGKSEVSVESACEGEIKMFLIENATTIDDIQRNLDAGRVLDMELPPYTVRQIEVDDPNRIIDTQRLFEAGQLLIVVKVPGFSPQSTIARMHDLGPWLATRQIMCGYNPNY
ncbi:MAG: hypothetical protein GY945_14945 [Rhodobacteraceae bacterium]|nr:hypothetical protein [Paracoccaceae bacterium]